MLRDFDKGYGIYQNILFELIGIIFNDGPASMLLHKQVYGFLLFCFYNVRYDLNLVHVILSKCFDSGIDLSNVLRVL